MLEEETDASLVAQARADNSYAFHVLIERYQVLLISIALRYTADEELARDLVQEAFLQAFLSLDHLRDTTRFKSWLYGILLNICRNWLREHKGKTLSLDASSANAPELLSTLSSSTQDPQELLEERELQAIMHEALCTLSPRNQAVAQLFYYEYLSMQEIADTLGISLTAVKSRLHKGREQLRSHILLQHPELVLTRGKGKKSTMVAVSLAKVQRLEKGFRTVIVLLDEQGRRVLPLWFSTIQSYQAMMSSPQLAGERPASPEPFTSDFIGHIIEALGGTVDEIGIDTLQGDMLYARVQLRMQNGTHVQTVKARLDDALPLALHLRCKLAIDEQVLNSRGIAVTGEGEALERQIDAAVAMVGATSGLRTAHTALTATVPRNLDFSQHLQGWSAIGYPMKPQAYEASIEPQDGASAGNMLVVTLNATKDATNDLLPYNTVMFTHEGFLAERYRGQRLRLIVPVKFEHMKLARFQITVAGAKIDTEGVRRVQYMTDTRQQPLEGSHDWTSRELVVDIPDDAFSIQIGFSLEHEGKLWLAPLRIEIVERNVPLTGTTRISPPHPPRNLDFARDLDHWYLDGSFPQDYACAIDPTNPYQGHVSATLYAITPEARGAVILQQTLNTSDYRGKRVQLRGMVKTLNVEQEAGIYMNRGLGDRRESIEYKTYGTTDWTPFEVTTDVAYNDPFFNIGLRLHGKGQVWLASVDISVQER